MNNNPVRNILWTGGWDSTYRLVELSFETISIQPIYVYGEGRKSENYEIRAMERIIEQLNAKSATEATILPIKYIHFDSIQKNKEISKGYNNLSSQKHFGSQYEWLPCLALKYNGLEIGIEKAPPEQSGAIAAIVNNGEVNYNEDKDTYLIDEANSNDDLIILFKNLSFPIINKTGEDMKANIFKWGYQDVMENVWMCFNPIFGKPCGTCNPCKSKMNTNMGFLLPPVSKRRYENRDKKSSQQMNRILQKVSTIIDKIRFK